MMKNVFERPDCNTNEATIYNKNVINSVDAV